MFCSQKFGVGLRALANISVLRKQYLALTVLALAACAARGPAPVLPSAVLVGAPQKIFVATNRAEIFPSVPSNKRNDALGFLDVTVSVPPKRIQGEILITKRGQSPNPSRNFVMAARDDISESAFYRDINSTLHKLAPIDREITLYVHGYNNTFSDGVFRLAQLQHDMGLPGAAVHFSWPSAAHPLGYGRDRDSMLFSRDALEKLLRNLRKKSSGRIVLVGHSMGTLLIMETLRQIEIASPGWSENALSGVVFISPDIDVDLFRSQAQRFRDMPQPFAIFVSNKDRALRFSALLSGSKNRLGSLTSAEPISDFPVTVIDVSKFAAGTGAQHFTAGTSPALLTMLSRSAELDRSFNTDRSRNAGLLSNTVITVRNATQIILSPGLISPR